MQSGLKFRRVHSEAMSTDESATARDMKHIKRIIKTYVPRDLWIANKFDLLHRQPQT